MIWSILLNKLCETVKRRVCKNNFLEAARSSGAQTKQDKSSIKSNDGSIKKCNSAPTCKIEKKKTSVWELRRFLFCHIQVLSQSRRS